MKLAVPKIRPSPSVQNAGGLSGLRKSRAARRPARVRRNRVEQSEGHPRRGTKANKDGRPGLSIKSKRQRTSHSDELSCQFRVEPCRCAGEPGQAEAGGMEDVEVAVVTGLKQAGRPGRVSRNLISIAVRASLSSRPLYASSLAGYPRSDFS